MPFAAVILWLPSAIAEGSAWPEQISPGDPLHDVLEKLLHTSGQWVVATAVDRGETEQQMLEIIELVIGLLKS